MRAGWAPGAHPASPRGWRSGARPPRRGSGCSHSLAACVSPRPTECVPQIIEFAARLEELGYTYVLPSGLYFDTSKSPGYGTLALLDLAGQRETGRVEHVEGRKLGSD